MDFWTNGPSNYWLVTSLTTCRVMCRIWLSVGFWSVTPQT